MRVALLTGADPKRSTGGPKVRLIKGDWLIKAEGVVDSILSFVLDSADSYEIGERTQLLLKDVAVVQVEFDKRGNERYLTVIAEKVA